MKKFSVDYWVNQAGDGDPDRTDYSDDLEYLLQVAPLRETENLRYGRFRVYERVGDGADEMQNWRLLREGGG